MRMYDDDELLCFLVILVYKDNPLHLVYFQLVLLLLNMVVVNKILVAVGFAVVEIVEVGVLGM
ncbi:expressed protein [Dictyostelium purpureum]|uniref:Expressed protein n=1 Tax=Dictyostelium purpureum TaxID=5786 RepID=F0ZD60_DICPU|nr:uncharacterized protein DICPUDRAFT_93902 [Dictyostelium purpureum]EGC38120.1 expressed protein [Dictyostelium purpureum]|eukprot:XP_003285334.1 expressed protein [Dictyostelium purpureum]